MKKLLKTVLAGAMILGLTACGNNDTTADEKGVTITVGISPDYPPYESLETDNSIVGFDPEMMALFEGYLTEKYGEPYHFELVQMDFSNIITQIQGSQVQVGISGFTWSEEREGKVDFSKPYCVSKQVAVVQKGSDITSLDDLNGKKLAVQTGTTGEYAAEDYSDDVTGLTNAQDLFSSLDGGQFDAIIVDSGVANNYANSGKYDIIEEALVDEENLVVVKVGDTDTLEKINYCIDTFLASDDYKTMCETYQLSPIE